MLKNSKDWENEKNEIITFERRVRYIPGTPSVMSLHIPSL